MRRYLAVEFCPGMIRAGIFRKGSPEATGYFEVPATGTVGDGLEALFTDINAKGYRKKMPVYLSVSPDIVSMRVVKFPFSDIKKIREVARFECRDLFLGDPEAKVFSTMTLSGERTLVAAVEKEKLGEYLDSMLRLGFEPEWIGLSMLSKDRLVYELHNGAEAAVLLDGETITAVSDRAPFNFACVRDAGDARRFLAALGEEGVDVKKLIATEDAIDLTDVGVEWETAKGHGGRDGLRALALHISEGFDNALDFRAEEVTLPWKMAKTGTSLKIQFAVTALLLVFAGSHAYMNMKSADAELARISSEMERAWKGVFPSEKSGAYAYLMESKLRRLEKEREALASGVDVVGVLKAVSDGVEPGAIRVTDVNISGDKVAVRAEAGSYEAAGVFRDALSKQAALSEIVLTDVKTAPVGVRFAVAARFGAGPDGPFKSP